VLHDLLRLDAAQVERLAAGGVNPLLKLSADT
jgi:hypothetical protein